MIIVYGNYGLTFTITSNHANAAFTAPAGGVGLVSGRSGSGQALTWDVGTQSLGIAGATITCTCTTAYDNPAAIGKVGVYNVQGLPVGTLVTVTPAGGTAVNQRLVAGERGELNAHFICQQKANSFTVTFANDVNGTFPILTGTSFYIGQISVGRCVSLPTLNEPGMVDDYADPTASNRMNGQQLYTLMRKGFDSKNLTLGRFTTLQAKGGLSSNLLNGDLSGGVMDIRYLRDQLSRTQTCDICDVPSGGFGTHAVSVGGVKYTIAVMQNNWMLARPTSAGGIILDQAPFWVWAPSFQEAT